MSYFLFVIVLILFYVLYDKATKNANHIQEDLNDLKDRLDKLTMLLEKKKDIVDTDEIKEKVVEPTSIEEIDKKEQVSIEKELVKDEQKNILERVTPPKPPVTIRKSPAIPPTPPVIPTEKSNIHQAEKEIKIPVIPAAIADSERLASYNAPDIEENKKVKNIDYEKYIGENLFGKIGIFIFVLGVGFFVKYAIDKDWINETWRTVLGFLIGFALLGIAERINKKYRGFSSLLAGGAFAIFYLTVAIAFHYYGLFSQTAAFIILIVVTLFMIVLSILYDRRELAIVSLIGGFIAPFIVNTGLNDYLVLFTYLTILNVAMFALSMYKKWSELLIISFICTNIILLAFIMMGYYADSPLISAHLFIYVTVFYFIYLLPLISIYTTQGADGYQKHSGLTIIVLANNFIYLLAGLLFLSNINFTFKVSGLLCLFIALVNLVQLLWLRRYKKEYVFHINATLGLLITFVSLAVPLQLSGYHITLFWATEMVLLLWLFIKSRIKMYEVATLLMIFFTALSFPFSVHYEIGSVTQVAFFNSTFVTSIYLGLAAGAMAFLISRFRSILEDADIINYNPWNAIFLLSSATIIYLAIAIEIILYVDPAVNREWLLLFTSAAITALFYGFSRRFPLKEFSIPYLVAIGVNVFAYFLNSWLQYDYFITYPISGALLLQWIALVFTVINISFVAYQYYKHSLSNSTYFTIYLNLLCLITWLTMVRSFLCMSGVYDFSAGFSIAMSIAGFIQMGLGMRLHQKTLRIISLCTFGIVLIKLVGFDLWQMPTIGKIIVFIILGLLLLILSFLYQKLRNVLFKNDEDEADNIEDNKE